MLTETSGINYRQPNGTYDFKTMAKNYYEGIGHPRRYETFHNHLQQAKSVAPDGVTIALKKLVQDGKYLWGVVAENLGKQEIVIAASDNFKNMINRFTKMTPGDYVKALTKLK